MKFLDFDRVLCLSPHPDDVELGMFGTIMKYQDTHFTVLCITKGGTKCLNGVNAQNRVEEGVAAWEVVQAPNATVCFADCDYLTDKDGDSEWVNYLETEFLEPGAFDAICIPTKDDSMFEHRFVNGLGPTLARHTALSLIEYRTPSTQASWQPNLFVNIEDVYDKKVLALQSFISQKGKSYFTPGAIDSFHSNYQCAKKGHCVVEQFKVVEIYARIRT